MWVNVVKEVTPTHSKHTNTYWSVFNVRCIIYNMHIICLTVGFSKAVWRRRDQCCCCFYFSLWNKWYRPSRSSSRRWFGCSFFLFIPSHIHPPSPSQQPSARTAICCSPHKYTQHPGVPYTGEKLSIPVSFLYGSVRVRAHTNTHTHCYTTDDGREKKNYTYIIKPNFCECRFLFGGGSGGNGARIDICKLSNATATAILLQSTAAAFAPYIMK